MSGFEQSVEERCCCGATFQHRWRDELGAHTPGTLVNFRQRHSACLPEVEGWVPPEVQHPVVSPGTPVDVDWSTAVGVSRVDQLNQEAFEFLTQLRQLSEKSEPEVGAARTLVYGLLVAMHLRPLALAWEALYEQLHELRQDSLDRFTVQLLCSHGADVAAGYFDAIIIASRGGSSSGGA